MSCFSSAVNKKISEIVPMLISSLQPTIQFVDLGRRIFGPFTFRLCIKVESTPNLGRKRSCKSERNLHNKRWPRLV